MGCGCWVVEAVKCQIYSSTSFRDLTRSWGSGGDGATGQCGTVTNTSAANTVMTSLELHCRNSICRCRFGPTPEKVNKEPQPYHDLDYSSASPTRSRQDGARAEDVPAWYSQEDYQGALQLQRQQECRRPGQLSCLKDAFREELDALTTVFSVTDVSRLCAFHANV